MGTMKEDFHSRGTRPVEMERFQYMTERGGYGVGCGFEHPGRNAIWAGGGFGEEV